MGRPILQDYGTGPLEAVLQRNEGEIWSRTPLTWAPLAKMWIVGSGRDGSKNGVIDVANDSKRLLTFNQENRRGHIICGACSITMHALLIGRSNSVRAPLANHEPTS